MMSQAQIPSGKANLDSQTISHRQSYEHIFDSMGLKEDEKSYREVARLLGARPDWAVVDIACGEGGLLKAISECCSEIKTYGLDISFTAVQRAAITSPKSALGIGDAESLPYLDEVFDCVTCLGSIENFMNPIKALAEFHRVLKPGGKLCAMMPNKYWLEDVINIARGKEEVIPFQHVERVGTYNQWRLFLQHNGFDVQQIRGYVKKTPLFSNGKMRSIRKFLWNHLVSCLCPPQLSWSIIYFCVKGERKVHSTTRNEEPWIWRAERPSEIT